ncbi:MAG: N-acetylneuraminate synthase [Arenicella sp.]
MQMIEVAAKSGADAVKFQTFRAEDLSTAYAEKADYQKLATSGNESQQKMLKALELPEAVYTQLVDYCDQQGVEFMSTAFDIRSMDFLVSLGIKRIKIPSGELTNVPLLRHCAKQGLPIILSTGMASFDEISDAKKVLIDAGVNEQNLSILHCNTAYPTPFKDANLACIKTLGGLSASVGYSDHTLGDEAIIASLAMGASIVEKHFTLDRSLPGPDQATSLEPSELTRMVEKIRNIEQALGNGVKQPTESELPNISVARKSIVASKVIAKGEVFSDENLTTKRPGDGISAAFWDDMIGRKAARYYSVDEQIEY